jgi:hypothetical protein
MDERARMVRCNKGNSRKRAAACQGKIIAPHKGPFGALPQSFNV